MKKLLLGGALVGLVLSPTAQAQDDAAVFRPSSAWAADYGDDYCRLVRSFSDGKDEVTVMLQRVQPGADTQVMLIGDAIKPFRGAEELGWRFLPTDGERKSRYGRGEVQGQPYFRIENVMLTPFAPPAPGTPPGPPRYDRAAEQAATKALTGILVSTGVTKPVRIETGSLGAPIGALQACTDDLVKSWGLDAEKHKAMSMPAMMNPAPDGVLPQGTIPFTEFAKFAGGANQVRVMLDTAGKPTSCTIFSPTLEKGLNDRICQLVMQKASFTPAKDASGQPMATYWMGSPMFLGPPIAMGPR